MLLDRIYKYQYKSMEQEILVGDDIELSGISVMVSDHVTTLDTW